MTTESTTHPSQMRKEAPINIVASIPFMFVHIGCVLVLWTGVSTTAVAIGLVTFAVRMFSLTGGFHRYFCHKTYKTSRAFQFILAAVGTSAAQMGPLWWAGHHRHHHAHADTGEDVHPPGVKGFSWAHAGWIMSPTNWPVRWNLVRDFAKYRELVWLDNYHYVAPISLVVGLYGLGSWMESNYPSLGATPPQLVVVGFFISTTILYHVTFAVNSFGHTFGSRRYETGEGSTNSMLLALLTGGEGWHNNHHRYPNSERQGFYWWEVDSTHYVIVVLSWLGLVWDVQGPSNHVLKEGLEK